LKFRHRGSQLSIAIPETVSFILWFQFQVLHNATANVALSTSIIA